MLIIIILMLVAVLALCKYENDKDRWEEYVVYTNTLGRSESVSLERQLMEQWDQEFALNNQSNEGMPKVYDWQWEDPHYLQSIGFIPPYIKLD